MQQIGRKVYQESHPTHDLAAKHTKDWLLEIIIIALMLIDSSEYNVFILK